MRANEFIKEDSTVAGDVATISAPVGGLLRRIPSVDTAAGKYNTKRKKKNVSRRS